MTSTKSTKIWRNHDITKTSGHFLRTRSVGSIWEKHKKKDYSYGRPDPTPLSFYDSVIADCIEKVMSTREDTILNQKIPTPRPNPPNCLEICLARQWSAATVKHRARVLKDTPSKSTSVCKKYPQNAVLADPRTSGHDLRLGACAQSTIPNRICHPEFTKKRWIQYFQWEVQKDQPKLGRITRVVWSFYEDTVLSLCQVLARRIALLHLR